MEWRGLLKSLEGEGRLLRVSERVEASEAAVLARLLPSEHKTAVLLEDVEGREVGACTGLLLSEGDVAAALGLNRLDELDEMVEALIGAGVALSGLKRIAVLAKLSELASLMPRLV